jgi:hypothetical protein
MANAEGHWPIPCSACDQAIPGLLYRSEPPELSDAQILHKCGYAIVVRGRGAP